MTAQFEVHLQRAKEPLQVPYPRNYQGLKSGKDSDKEIHISCQPRYLHQDEIEVVEAFLAKLPYPQALIKTGAVMIGDDPLLGATHDELDELEANANLSNTRYVKTGGERTITERVLIIRERGYFGSSSKMLVG